MLDVDPDEYRLSTGHWTCSQRTHVRAAILNGNRTGAYDPRGGSTEAQYHLVWPNLTVNIEAGVPNLGIDVWWPDGPGRTVGVSDQWFAPEVPKALREEMIAFGEQVGLEDDSLFESVQRGLALGHGAARPDPARERAADRALPGPRVRVAQRLAVLPTHVVNAADRGPVSE